MSLYINYDDEEIIDLTPEEILEDQQLENQYFYQDQNEISHNTNTSELPQNAGNLFFDLSFYNFETSQQDPQNSKPQEIKSEPNTSNKKKRSLLEDTFISLKPPKKIASAWSNLNLNSNSDPNVSESNNNQSCFNDCGHIDPKFRRTHVPYAQKRALRAKKIEKEREKTIMEQENERISSGNDDIEIFYQEKIRRPLDGIHVEIDEKIEIDW